LTRYGGAGKVCGKGGPTELGGFFRRPKIFSRGGGASGPAGGGGASGGRRDTRWGGVEPAGFSGGFSLFPCPQWRAGGGGEGRGGLYGTRNFFLPSPGGRQSNPPWKKKGWEGAPATSMFFAGRGGKAGDRFRPLGGKEIKGRGREALAAPGAPACLAGGLVGWGRFGKKAVWGMEWAG